FTDVLADKKKLKQVTILQAATALSSQFGISVRSDTDTGAVFLSESINNGETVFSILDRMAKQRGVILGTDPDGTLVIRSLADGRATTAIVEGENVLSASLTADHSDRF